MRMVLTKSKSDRRAAPAQEPKPFLKWAGGKRQLLPTILERIPEQFDAESCTYHEPFVGGGAVFFALRPKRAILYDNNDRLVRTWKAIRDDVEKVIDELASYRHTRKFFLEMRERDIDRGTDVEVAAWLIYLNKTAYNGLYRVNSRNGFNVPFGRYDNPTICDAPNLRACARTLEGADIVHDDFTLVLRKARRGDLVYFDPPYSPLSTTSYFTSYTVGGFGVDDQTRLRDAALKLKKRGVHVLVSNSASDEIRNLYSDGFAIHEVLAMRAINSKADRRGKIKELLIG